MYVEGASAFRGLAERVRSGRVLSLPKYMLTYIHLICTQITFKTHPYPDRWTDFCPGFRY